MTFFVKDLDNQEYGYDVEDLNGDDSKEHIKEYIQDKLKLGLFDISYDYPLMDGSEILLTCPCEEIDEEEKEKYFEDLKHLRIKNNIYLFTSYFGHLECLKYAYENRYKELSKNSHGCLQYFEIDLEWDSLACDFSVQRGNLECLKYLIDNNCEYDEGVYHYAIIYNHLDCLKFLHMNGRIRDKSICHYSSMYGNLECLRYAHENGCEWNEVTCMWAVKKGHLECLRYAHKNGCKWDRRTTSRAAENGNFECLKYAVENGCDLGNESCDYASKYNHFRCANYIREILKERKRKKKSWIFRLFCGN